MRVTAMHTEPFDNCSDGGKTGPQADSGFFPSSQGLGATLKPVDGAYDGIHDHRNLWVTLNGFPCPVCGYMDLMGKNENVYVHVTPYHGRPRICRFQTEEGK